uniref:Putative group i salivary lipocalin n=1 Tax=Rhipicephalus pulchellus TaxID=72859 RepID=L7LQW3_RHIPC
MYKASIILLAVLVFNAAESRKSGTITIGGVKLTNYSVEQFMNTNAQIWTVLTSKTPAVYCTVDMVQNITDDTIFFTRTSMEPGGIWDHRQCKGIVQFKQLVRNIMLVTCQAGKKSFPGTYEVLEFADGNDTCGVFYVVPAKDFHKGTLAAGWYDFRLKYNNKGEPFRKCLIEFNIKVGKKKQQSKSAYNEGMCSHNKFWRT